MADEERFDTSNVEETVYDESTLLGRIRNKAVKCKRWIKDNKELAIMAFIGIFGALIGIADSHSKNEKKRENHEKTYRTIYDSSNRHYIVSKKDIKPSQQREIDRRRQNGEDLYDICNDLGIKLKR